MAHLNWRKLGPGPTEPADEPLFDAEELLDIAPVDLKVPFDPREVLARIVDGSRFEEYKPLYGTCLVTGWASIHGFPVGVLANARGVLFNEEAKKATEFILLATRPTPHWSSCRTPRASWSASSTSSAGSSRTAPR